MPVHRSSTYWVNFHVVGLPSASTMILNKDCRTPAGSYQCNWSSVVFRTDRCVGSSVRAAELVIRPGGDIAADVEVVGEGGCG
jgi:hypothetical protein